MIEINSAKRHSRKHRFVKEQADLLNEAAEILADRGLTEAPRNPVILLNLIIRLAYFTLTTYPETVTKWAKTGIVIVPDDVLDAHMSVYNTPTKWNRLSTLNKETENMVIKINHLLKGDVAAHAVDNNT